MSDLFVDRLRRQLREAAEREAERGPVGRAAVAVRHDVAPRAAALVAVLALVLSIAVAGVQLRDRPREPAGASLHLVDRVDLTSGGGSLAAGFGAAWATDPGSEELLRIDPASRRVRSRLAVGGLPLVQTGAGAVWVLDTDAGRLLRVDPDGGAVTARTRLGVGARVAVGLVPGRRAMWVVTPIELLRVDARRAVVDRRLPLRRDGFEAAGIVMDGDRLLVLYRDGFLATLDGRTGARLAGVPARAGDFLLAAAGATAVVATSDGVAALDAATGRVRWRRDLGTARVDRALVARDALWLHLSAGAGAGTRDRLQRLDVVSGRSTGSLALTDLGAASMTAVGDRIWVLTSAGRLLVVD